MCLSKVPLRTKWRRFTWHIHFWPHFSKLVVKFGTLLPIPFSKKVMYNCKLLNKPPFTWNWQYPFHNNGAKLCYCYSQFFIALLWPAPHKETEKDHIREKIETGRERDLLPCPHFLCSLNLRSVRNLWQCMCITNKFINSSSSTSKHIAMRNIKLTEGGTCSYFYVYYKSAAKNPCFKTK